MGLPGSSSMSADILPILIVNIAVSLRLMKHLLVTLLQEMGLFSPQPRSGEASAGIEFADDFSFCSALTSSGLSSETLQALPLAVYNPEQHGDVQRDVDCPVCLQEINVDEEVRLLPFCRHLFHRGCLDRWLEQEQLTCPVCRSSLVPDEICKRQQQREQDVAEDLMAWFSSPYGPGFQGLWCYN